MAESKTSSELFDAPSSGGSSVAIVDQSLNGYLDVGNTRIQWGSFDLSAATDLVLPMPFGGPDYSFTATVTTSSPYYVIALSHSSTQVNSVRVVNSNSGSTVTSSENIRWQAIGPINVG